MTPVNNSEMLKDKDIITEINRYKWLESEKLKTDIGFERASREWIQNCSNEYLTKHPGKSSVLWLKSQPIYNAIIKEIELLK